MNDVQGWIKYRKEQAIKLKRQSLRDQSETTVWEKSTDLSTPNQLTGDEQKEINSGLTERANLYWSNRKVSIEKQKVADHAVLEVIFDCYVKGLAESMGVKPGAIRKKLGDQL